MLILSEEQLRGCIDMADAIEAVEGAFAALAEGRARLPPPVSLELPEVEGEVHVKGAHLAGEPTFAFKVASGFYRNPERGLPSGSGLVLVFDATTGRPEALLLDNSYLTDVRTGAAGGVATRYLARERLTRVAVIGAGVQARMQLRALACVRALPPVVIWARDSGRAQGCAVELEAELDTSVKTVGSVEQAVRGSDLVITATPSRVPLVQAEWLMPGVHVTAVGSDGAGKQELAAAVLVAADVIVADHIGQCERLGELQHLGSVRDQACTVEALGDVVLGRARGRQNDGEITVADLTGVGVQDAAIAALAMRRAGC